MSLTRRLDLFKYEDEASLTRRRASLRRWGITHEARGVDETWRGRQPNSFVGGMGGWHAGILRNAAILLQKGLDPTRLRQRSSGWTRQEVVVVCGFSGFMRFQHCTCKASHKLPVLPTNPAGSPTSPS